MELKDKLRLLRVLKGLRQEEVAAALGVLRSVVARHEAGAMVPRDRIIAKYSEILGNVSFEWLKDSTMPAYWGEVFRPLSPFSRYTHATIRTVGGELSKLTEMLEVLGIDAVHVLESELGHIVVAASDHVAFAVIARQELSEALLPSIPAQSSPPRKIEDRLFYQTITDPVQHIDRILGLCNIKSRIDAEKMCLSYTAPSADAFRGVSVKVDIAGGAPEIVNDIKAILITAGINVASIELLNDSSSEDQLDPEFKVKAKSCGLDVR